MNKNLPQRKRTRLSKYDYSSVGYYFITACTKDKHCIFGTVVGRGILDAPQVKLSSKGMLVESTLIYLDEHSEHIHIDKYIIMPNHVHLILEVRSGGTDENGASGMPRPTNAVVPQFISSLKRFTNLKSGQMLWQTSYYDHIIRNEEDHLRIWQYIDDNPAKWEEDKYYMAQHCIGK